jgi:hypothetical protein
VIAVDMLYTSKTLFLKGAVSINVYMAFEGADFLTQEYIMANAGLLVWHEADLPADLAAAVWGSESYIAEMEYSGPYGGHIEYIATTEGIPAKEYGDKLYFRSYILVDGEYQYGELFEYSVKDYCEGRFEKSKNTELKSALVALLNFGAAAQEYFDYKTDALVNANMHKYLDRGWIDASMVEMNWDSSYLVPLDSPDPEMTVNFTQTESLSDNSNSLFLKGAISINYFTTIGHDLGTLENAQSHIMYFWTEERYAELRAAGTPLTKDNASYYVEAELVYSNKYGWEFEVMSEPISAKDWGNTIYSALCVTDNAGIEHCSGVLVYSPLKYAANKVSGSPNSEIARLSQWMAIYSKRAIEYFN